MFVQRFVLTLVMITAPILVISHESNDDNIFENMPIEMRCNGCLMTLKAISGMLLNSKREDLETRIETSLNNACDESRLKVSEYNPKVVVKVCQYLKKNHKQELIKELRAHFGQMTHSTYLPVAHHICQTMLRMCPGPSTHQHGQDEAWVHLNDKTQEFQVKPGKNMKIPRPVPEHSRDEL